jgi:hypothetical protein
MTHGNEDVAGDDTVVRSLPSVDAPQSRCRAFCALCHAGMSHGKASISGSDGCKYHEWPSANGSFSSQKFALILWE